MPFWCGSWETAGGFWWVFPVLGLAFILVMAFACFRGCGWRGWRAGRTPGEVAELRREIQELKEDLRKVLRNPS
jgi:hypothetical protein